MKLTVLISLLSLMCFTLQAQDYVDVFKISGNKTSLGNLEDDYEANMNNINAELYYPTRINEKLEVLIGFTIENTNISLFDGANNGNLNDESIISK